MPLSQSVPIMQCFPAMHISHTRPPQSTSVSSPSTASSLSQRGAPGAPAIPPVSITGDAPAPGVTVELPAAAGELPAAAGEPPVAAGERPALPAPARPASPPLLDESSPCCKYASEPKEQPKGSKSSMLSQIRAFKTEHRRWPGRCSDRRRRSLAALLPRCVPDLAGARRDTQRSTATRVPPRTRYCSAGTWY